MTTSAPVVPPHPGTATPVAEPPAAVWKALAPQLVAPGRARSIKLANAAGKYSGWAVPLPAKPPARPAAALLYDHQGRARWLAIDLDPVGDDVPTVRAAALALSELLRRAGFHPFLDRSPRGGIHIWARLPQPEPLHFVMPLMHGVKKWLNRRFPGVGFDLAPMSNPSKGCLTLPGSPCKGGGHRQLITPLREALAAVETVPDIDAPQRLARVVDVTLGDLLAPIVDHTLEDDQALIPGGRQGLPPVALDYFTDGTVNTGAGISETRRSALLYALWRGWCFNDLREGIESGQFAGLAAHIHRRGKGGLRYLRQEWRRASSTVANALESRRAESFRQSAHTHVPLHGGAPTHWTNLWLGAAELWAIKRFSGSRLLTVLAVLQGSAWLALVQDNQQRSDDSTPSRTSRYTGEVSGEPSRVAELPVRSVHLVAGLIGIETIADVLRELHDTAGSPLLLVSSGAGTSRGSRYYLRQLDACGAAPATRPELIDPVWSELGLAAWRVHAVLRATDAQTASELVHQTGLGKTAVYNALRILREHELVAGGDGQAYAVTELTPASAGRLIGADARYAAALERIRAERQSWKDLLASWELDARERAATGVPDDAVEGPAETPDVDPAAVDSVLGPVPWESILLRDPDPDPYETSSVEDQVLDLLRDVLGAMPLVPEGVAGAPDALFLPAVGRRRPG